MVSLTDRGVFKSALVALANRREFGRANCRLLRGALEDEGVADAIYEGLGPDAELGELGDGKFLDRFEKWFKWVWENREAILAFVQKVVAIIIAVVSGL